MIEKGDSRALGMIERLYADSARHVEICGVPIFGPHSAKINLQAEPSLWHLTRSSGE